MSAPPPWATATVIADRRPAALRREWEDRALCRGLPAGEAARLFFPTGLPHRGNGTQAEAYRQTVDDWCARCPVNTDCVATNVTEQDGVFGSTPAQRRTLRRELARLGVRVEPVRVDPRAGVPRSDSAIRAARARGA